jgi:hypothetical protein
VRASARAFRRPRPAALRPGDRGEDLSCSRQLFVEAKWLLGYTAWWDRLDQTLDALEASFELPDQAFASEALPIDGLFGLCNRKYFIRIEATLEAYFVLAEGRAAAVPAAADAVGTLARGPFHLPR